MSQITIISNIKEEIPRKYLEQLFKLMQVNNQEILKIKPPSIGHFKRAWVLGSSSEEKICYLLAINPDDEVIGYGLCSWNINYDNLDKGYVWVHIAKKYRRKGYGTQLFLKAVEILPEQITGLYIETFEDTDGILFVKSLGVKEAYKETLSASDLTKFNPEEVKKEAKVQREKANEKGYEIIYIDALEEILHVDFNKYVEMLEEIWNDMPREELTFEDYKLSIERVKKMNQRRLLRGDSIMTFVAIHKESGDPIGVTNSYLNEFQSTLARQGDTGIVRAHRGHGLGLVLKYQMLEKLLFETDAKLWRTGNAGSNEHMLRINQLLKYEPFTCVHEFEVNKKDLLKRLK
ncbi:MAG: GNAT family N-acetyltransferase [Candidatus Heimdallarchaeaceae archaeon]